MTIVLTGLIIGIAVGSAVSGAVIDRVGARQGYWVAVLAAAAAFLMAIGTRAFLARREMANLRRPATLSVHVQRVPAQRHTAAVCRSARSARRGAVPSPSDQRVRTGRDVRGWRA